MKQYIKNLGLCAGLSIGILNSAQAQYDTSQGDPFNGTEINSSIQQLTKYFVNLGLYLGYPVQNAPQNGGGASGLLNQSLAQSLQSYALTTTMGATPVNAVSQALSLFVPSSDQALAFFNSYANLVYNQSNQGSNGKVFISPLIDQQTYQQDPVSQAVLNILTTPDFSFCIKSNGTDVNSNCSFKYGGLVSQNVTGTIPLTPDFFTFDTVQPFLSELNSNSLLAPLTYNDSGSNTQSGASPTSQQNKGLVGESQLSAAANFIKFATGAAVPLNLASESDYSTLYTTAFPSDSNTSITEVQKVTAQNTLANYLSSVKMYAAQTSIAASNVYYIFGKRLIQQQGTGDNAPQTSQAANEYRMATWRLFDPEQSQNNEQWISKIATSSPATVQKEIAILLSEINYQLYLNRQQQERLLLTNSIMLLNGIRANPPSINASASASSTSTN